MADERACEIVVVGASAGGVEALTELAASLPERLDAAVVVVLHVAAAGPSLLPKILDRAGPLPSDHVRHHEVLEHGRIYVAPPDQHLTLSADGLAVLGRGPRENGHRPSIDQLFRSAAEAYGSRATGVILTGALDDGSVGLAAIARAGGMTLVQAPETALYPSMPKAALAAVPEAQALEIDGIVGAIMESIRAREDVPTELEVKMAITDNGKEASELERGDDHVGAITGFTCPECSGTLWEIRDGELVRFECRVGHSYSTESLVGAHAESLEAGLWAASRALHEKAAIAKRLALRFEASGQTRSANRFAEQAREAMKMADDLRGLIERLPSAPVVDESLAGV